MGLFDENLLSMDYSGGYADYSLPSLDLSGVGDYSGYDNYSNILDSFGSSGLSGLYDYSDFGSNQDWSSLFSNIDVNSLSDLSGLFGSTNLSGIGDYSGADGFKNLVDSLGESSLLGIGDYSGADGFANLTDAGLSLSDAFKSTGDFATDDSSGTSWDKLLSSLSKMLGGSKTGGILGSQNTNDLVKALLAVMAKRDSNSNQAKNIQTAQQLARSGSQQGLAPNRTGLTNLNTDSRDPMSYVQQAPTIQR